MYTISYAFNITLLIVIIVRLSEQVYQYICLLSKMLQNLGSCILLEGFINFSVNPYYDPLSLVMIDSILHTYTLYLLAVALFWINYCTLQLSALQLNNFREQKKVMSILCHLSKPTNTHCSVLCNILLYHDIKKQYIETCKTCIVPFLYSRNRSTGFFVEKHRTLHGLIFTSLKVSKPQGLTRKLWLL